MNCKKCGNEITEGAVFCVFCGEKVEIDNKENIVNGNNTMVENTEPKVWGIFSKVGLILGIVSLCLCWVPYLSTTGAIAGIVLSSLGQKSSCSSCIKKARLGKTLSIIATIISFVVSVIISTYLELYM